jgi:Calcineurin-like phosphoesterase
MSRTGRFPARLALLLGLALAPLLFPAPADIPFEWTGIDRVVAVADLHGDYERFVFILTHPQIDLVDAELHWKGGRTHLVQLGDILDRGNRAKDILDLLMRLEKEAAEAGGMVHVLLGNHEEMNITGIALDYPGYVTVPQFLDFATDEFRRAKDEAYFKTLGPEEQRKAELEGLDPAADEGYASYWRKIVLGKSAEATRAYVNGFNQVYGRWLAQKNTIIKIDDVLYVHGGLSEALSHWPLREINQVMRSELEFFQGHMRNPQDYGRPFHPRLVYDPDSPLWFRGLATKDQKTAQAEVDRTLSNVGARAMVIGHNYFSFSGGGSPTVDRKNVSRFQDKVWIMDTGISGSYGGIPSALIFDRGEFKVWGETEELAARSGIRPPPPKPLTPREMETFLRTAAVTGRGPGPGGRTDAWRLNLESQGAALPALFKYIDRRRPDPLADSFRYDLAAYVLSKYLGLSCVPPIVERTVEDVPGAVQAFIGNARSVPDRRERKMVPPDPDAYEKAAAELIVLQALVYDDCRNEKDTLVTDDGRIYRVDFSEAFAPNKGDAPGCNVLRCSRLLFGRLLAWDEARVARYLGRYLSKDELDALNARRDFVVRRIRMNIRTLGESNVLF